MYIFEISRNHSKYFISSIFYYLEVKRGNWNEAEITRRNYSNTYFKR